MDYETAPESYQRAFDRLETEVTTVTGTPTTSCLPAVFEFPEGTTVSAQDIHDAATTDDEFAIDPFIDEKEDGFYYASGRIYRVEAEPDFEIRADANTLRLFESPYDAEEPLPTLDFEEFAAILQRIEDALGLSFEPHEETAE